MTRPIRLYVIATGLVFALLTAVHIWRVFEEPGLMSDAWFIGATIVSAALGIAAALVARRT